MMTGILVRASRRRRGKRQWWTKSKDEDDIASNPRATSTHPRIKTEAFTVTATEVSVRDTTKAADAHVDWEECKHLPDPPQQDEPPHSTRFPALAATVAGDAEHRQHVLDRTLIRAVHEGNHEQVTAALSEGADPWCEDWNYTKRHVVSTLVALSTLKGDQQNVTQALLKNESRRPRQRLRRDFQYLCEVCRAHQLQPLLNHYGRALTRGYEGSPTPLHHACMTANLSAMNVLVRYGASWRARVDANAATPLHLFAFCFQNGCYYNTPAYVTNGVSQLAWLWQHHAGLLFVRDGNDKTALQCIMGRVGVEAQTMCVLKLLALRRD